MNDLLLPASLSYLSKVFILLLENFIFLCENDATYYDFVSTASHQDAQRGWEYALRPLQLCWAPYHTFFPYHCAQQHIHQICSWLTVMVVISGDNESTQRLSQWFKDNNLVLKMSRTWDRTIDFTVIKHLIISRNCVEKVTDVQFLGFYNNKSLNVWLRRQSRDLTSSSGSSWRILSPETLYFFFCTFFVLLFFVLLFFLFRLLIIIISSDWQTVGCQRFEDTQKNNNNWVCYTSKVSELKENISCFIY